jgi:hypothetical protein
MYYETSIVRMAGKRITRMGDFIYGRTSENPLREKFVEHPFHALGRKVVLRRSANARDGYSA